MVLTSPEHSISTRSDVSPSPMRKRFQTAGGPTRGTTLPSYMRPHSTATQAGTAGTQRTARAHTLPSRAQTVQVNKQKHSSTWLLWYCYWYFLRKTSYVNYISKRKTNFHIKTNQLKVFIAWIILQDLNNVINLSNLNLTNSQHELSRTTPISLSILSLPNSDNEGFSFANWWENWMFLENWDCCCCCCRCRLCCCWCQTDVYMNKEIVVKVILISCCCCCSWFSHCWCCC